MSHTTIWLYGPLPVSLQVGVVIAVATLTMYSRAAAQTVPRGIALANACAACHGPEGHSTGAIPPLHGMSAKTLRESVRAFRSGERSGTVMPRIVQGLEDSDIEALAAYFTASQQP